MKIGNIPIPLHRKIPDDAKLKQVTLKKELTGEWFAIFGVEVDREPPTKPENPERCVGIDVRILKYAHDSDGFSVGSLDLSDEHERLECEQRNSRGNNTGKRTTASNSRPLHVAMPT